MFIKNLSKISNNNSIKLHIYLFISKSAKCNVRLALELQVVVHHVEEQIEEIHLSANVKVDMCKLIQVHQIVLVRVLLILI